MATFLNHEPCPACGSKDNLARYDDGSAWCFGCGHYEPASKHKKERAIKTAYKALPDEVATLPPALVQELILRGLSPAEQALFTYSPRLDRLCFRLGEFMEARSFTKKPKTLSFGTKPFHVFGEGTPVVVVEDLFSAIRVGRVTSAVPLFGSVIPTEWMRLLTRLSRDVILWLDADKYREAIGFARRIQLLGANVRVVKTDLDPKNYSEQEVKKVLDIL